jgi:predicted nucleic acid-binding protein
MEDDMEKPKIYLDICCFNRPYDDQTQLKIELETKAKLFIQNLVATNKLLLVWSYIMDYENNKNKHTQKSLAIQKWQDLAVVDIDETPEIIMTSQEIQKTGIKNVDSIHLACAISAKCDYFITVDRRVMKFINDKIVIYDPVEFIRMWGDIK